MRTARRGQERFPVDVAKGNRAGAWFRGRRCQGPDPRQRGEAPASGPRRQAQVMLIGAPVIAAVEVGIRWNGEAGVALIGARPDTGN